MWLLRYPKVSCLGPAGSPEGYRHAIPLLSYLSHPAFLICSPLPTFWGFFFLLLLFWFGWFFCLFFGGFLCNLRKYYQIGTTELKATPQSLKQGNWIWSLCDLFLAKEPGYCGPVPHIRHEKDAMVMAKHWSNYTMCLYVKNRIDPQISFDCDRCTECL